MTGSQVRDRPIRPVAGIDPGPGIDPRILARMVSVRRQRHQRRRRVATVGLAVVTAVVVAWAVARSPVLAVRRVVVEGAARTGRADVVAAAALGRRRPLLDVKPASVRQRLLALPWVARVDVARDWPSTVTIRIRERVPAARVAGPAGQTAVIDEEGRVVTVGPTFAGMPAEQVPTLPWLAGTPAGAPGSTLGRAAMPALSALAALLPVAGAGANPVDSSPSGSRSEAASRAPAGSRNGSASRSPAGSAGGAGGSGPAARQVSAVVVGPDGSLQATVSPGPITVLLGTADALGAKVQALRPLLVQVPAGAAATIDVRVPDVPVLTNEQIGTMVSTTQRG